MAPVSSSRCSSFRRFFSPPRFVCATSVRTTTPRLVAASRAFAMSGRSNRKMTRSISFLACRIAARNSDQPSRGCTMSFMGSATASEIPRRSNSSCRGRDRRRSCTRLMFQPAELYGRHVESELFAQIESLRNAVVRLPIAAGLSAILAFRPRRRGTPERQSTVVQTQIILAIVGAVVMLVVGASLARAFGIVGAAGLVRYRAKIDDPKDAGVMLSTLAIGLAAGVGVWMLATFATVFIVAVLWVIESFEKARQAFLLTVKMKDPAALKPKIEELMNRQ